jgi:hypothetical protein
MNFKDIEFGATEAEYEKSYLPGLLLDGYLDEYGYTNQILKGPKFVILGSKGSGKSAIGSRLELLAKNAPHKDFFVTQYYLERDFPYNTFTELIPGKEAPENRYPNHWEFLLLITLLDSFRKDKILIDSGEINSSSLELLEKLGMINRSLSELVTKAKKSELEVSLKIIRYKSATDKEEKPLSIDLLFQILRESVYSIENENTHLIIIDGLDDMLSHREKQYRSIMALFIAADRINKKLKDSGTNAKIVILCRTDLFDRLSDSNKNKIAQNSSITLNWYQDITNLKSTNLVKLINLRAKISLKQPVDVFDVFFPKTIDNDQPTLKVLLSYTRHTPRDFIELINKIKEHSSGEKVTQFDITNGIHEYSNEYFQREIRDELHGFVDKDDDINTMFLLLTKIGKATFSYDDISRKKASDKEFASLDLDMTLKLLYNCSAIGNYKQRSGGYSWKYKGGYRPRKKILTFKYLNPHSKFESNEDITIHRGLRKYLNIRS